LCEELANREFVCGAEVDKRHCFDLDAPPVNVHVEVATPVTPESATVCAGLHEIAKEVGLQAAA